MTVETQTISIPGIIYFKNLSLPMAQQRLREDLPTFSSLTVTPRPELVDADHNVVTITYVLDDLHTVDVYSIGGVFHLRYCESDTGMTRFFKLDNTAFIRHTSS